MVYLEPQTIIKKWMFGETTISYVKIGNHPIETTIYKWLFGVPGRYYKTFLFFWELPLLTKYINNHCLLACKLVSLFGLAKEKHPDSRSLLELSSAKLLESGYPVGNQICL